MRGDLGSNEIAAHDCDCDLELEVAVAMERAKLVIVMVVVVLLEESLTDCKGLSQAPSRMGWRCNVEPELRTFNLFSIVFD